MLVFSFYFGSINPSLEGEKRFNMKWLIFALIASVSNGILGIFQKLHTIALAGEDTLVFFAVSFSIAAVFMWIATLYSGKKSHSKSFRTLFSSGIGKLIILTLCTALCGGIGNWLTMILAGKMNANVLFPVANGGILITTSVFSIILFNEKLNFRQTIGIILGGTAILLISNIL